MMYGLAVWIKAISDNIDQPLAQFHRKILTIPVVCLMLRHNYTYQHTLPKSQSLHVYIAVLYIVVAELNNLCSVQNIFNFSQPRVISKSAVLLEHPEVDS